MIESWKKFRSLITRDVENENEVKMYAIIIRVVLILFSLYCDLGAIFTVINHQYGICIFMLIESLVAIWLICLTYHNKTMGASYMGCLLTGVHIVVHSLYYGTNTDLLQYTYVIILLIFAVDFLDKMWKKLCAMVCIMALRVIMAYYCITHPVVYELNVYADAFWRISHILLVSVSMAIIIIIATSDFSQMRKKLTVTNNRLRDVASKDPLTGLSNRRSAYDFLHRCIDDYNNGGLEALTLVMCDVDFFKKVNDTYGHDNGDVVLKDLANIIGAFMRDKGLASRWGGEEFVLVFTNQNGDQVYQELAALQSEIAKLSYDWNGDNVHITLTFGVAEQGGDSSVENTIKEADEKLYIGKEKGRNIIIF